MQPRRSPFAHSVESLESRLLLSAAAGAVADGLTHAQLQSLYAAGRKELAGGSSTSDPLGIVSNSLRDLYYTNPSGVGINTQQFGSLESSKGNPGVSIHTRGSVSTLLKQLDKLGVTLINVVSKSHLIDGYLPLSSLVLAAKLPGVNAITAITKPTVNSEGIATDQAESDELADAARNLYGVDGTGVKIGVISDSANQVGNGIADSISTGDLPSDVTILKDGLAGDTDEGRAMMEELHDMAPGASLYFYSGDPAQDNMVSAITALRHAGCNIIVDDLGYADEPMFQDGVISQAINTFVAGGGSYFSAIGNDGNSGYLNTNVQYTTTNGTTWVNFAGNGTVAGETMSFATAGPIDMDFQWDNPYNGDTGSASTELDVLIYQNNQLVASGTEKSLTTGIPEQVLPTLQAGDYQMKVQVAAVSPGAALPGMIKFVGSEDAESGITAIQYGNGFRSSGYGHATGQNTISVGAVEFASAPPFSNTTPIKNETYSSTGPVVYDFNEYGVKLASPLTLDKPDVSGIDGINTSFFGDYMPDDPTTLPQFYGTSAAAPNVAAIGALIDQYHPGATEAQILAALESSTTPLNGAAAGAWDSQGGYGLVNAEKALAYFGAAPVTPTVQLAPVASPTQNPVSSETITFNEPVTGFTLANLSLTFNGGPNLLTGAETLTTSDQTVYTLADLSSLTNTAGTYKLTLSPTGIADGNQSMTTGASISWVNQAPVAPTVSLAAVGTPRTTSVSSETIKFNEAVTGFSLANLSLSLNGGGNLLTGTQTLTSSNQITFTLGGLSSVTTADGVYTLTLDPAGISSTANGLSLASGGTVVWQNNAPNSAPTVALAAVTTPRTTAVASEAITFNVPVTGLKVSSFTLSRNFSANLINSAVTLTSTGSSTYSLNNLTALTSIAGGYVLTLSPTGISGTAGALSSGATISWQLTQNAIAAPTVALAAITTPRTSAVASEAISFNEAVSGFALADLSLTLNGGKNLLTSAQTLTSSNQIAFTLGNLAAITAAVGTYKLTLTPTGISGGGGSLATGASVSWTVQKTVGGPSVALGAITTPRTTAIASETITFSEVVAGFTLADLVLSRNGGANLLTSAQTLTTSNHIAFTLNGLTALTTPNGTYTLTLKTTGITGGGVALANGASLTWTKSATVAAASVVGRHLFYFDSIFDGYSTTLSAAVDKDIATNKIALLPGQTATYANISDYSRGIDGIMIDVSGLASSKLTAADFTFKTGNVNTTSTWATGPAPVSVVVRPGAGVSGSSRIEILWSSFNGTSTAAVGRKWLQVTLKADANTGLAAASTFYFGSAIGDTDLNAKSAAVTSADVTTIKSHESTTKVPITSNYDINRDGVIDAADATLTQNNETSGAAILALIKPV